MNRQEKILSSLDELTYANRKQLQAINRLGGDRNAHRILYAMEKDKLISSIRSGEKVYFLSNRGRDRIGSEPVELKKSMIVHTLMRNDLYVGLGMPADWRKERPIKWGEDERQRIIPDAYFTQGGQYRFVEIDNQQAMKTNTEKIKRYSELSRGIHQQYGHVPTVIWYTISDTRKRKLEEICSKYNVKTVIYGNM